MKPPITVRQRTRREPRIPRTKHYRQNRLVVIQAFQAIEYHQISSSDQPANRYRFSPEDRCRCLLLRSFVIENAKLNNA